MPDKMLKFTDIEQQSPIKREISIRKDDFTEIYAEYTKDKFFNTLSSVVKKTKKQHPSFKVLIGADMNATIDEELFRLVPGPVLVLIMTN